MHGFVRTSAFALAGSLALGLLGPPAYAQEAVIEVADGVYAFDPSDGYNSMFVEYDILDV